MEGNAFAWKEIGRTVLHIARDTVASMRIVYATVARKSDDALTCRSGKRAGVASKWRPLHSWERTFAPAASGSSNSLPVRAMLTAQRVVLRAKGPRA